MFRLILFLSLFPIAISLVARWWFGMRILARDGNRPCRCDLTRWLPSPDDAAIIHRAEESAGEFGRQLRLKALAEWQAQEPKAAASRENTRRFGLVFVDYATQRRTLKDSALWYRAFWSRAGATAAGAPSTQQGRSNGQA